ncbi:uncharacterized protein C9orf57 homolog [Carlito syrichta]|uniref:Uncharacterized protein C9orf57 homolog n=1 Tax=Carlito syrichta TaxID=1868482 RepID=A0A3Q0EJA7_CARSF|nr:uncharacterized protein C9orf57 homolog [Carlito syrichta]
MMTMISQESFNGRTCLAFHLLTGNLTMKRIVFAGDFILFCLLGDVGGTICRLCNLSLPFHGCILDSGTCKTKPDQHCIRQIYSKGGIEWYSTKGCTENSTECFQRNTTSYMTRSSHCCYSSLCNL